jgi:flagellar M-ring protein FliF
MATGIQTGIRTGSAPLPTGKGPAPGGAGGGLGKIMKYFNSMNPKLRIALFAGLAILFIALISMMQVNKMNEAVPLFPTALTQSDVTEVSAKMTELGYHYTVQAGKIYVNPGQKSRIQMQLAYYGLPHRSIITPTNKPADSGGLQPQTDDEKRFMRQQMLEGELIEAIREVEGVADARVKLVLPEQRYFKDDQKPATAAVMLKLQPNARLSPQQIDGIVNLVAYAVPELAPENVAVMDTKGFRLNRTADVGLPGGASGASLPTTQQDMKDAYERALQSKIQSVLDKALGPNKAYVTVNADLDFSQSKIKATKYGGAGNTTGSVKSGGQTEIEKFNTKPGEGGDGAEQYSLPDDIDTDCESAVMQLAVPGDITNSGKGTNAKYVKVKKAEKNLVDETTKETITAPGAIKRLTIGVMVNNLKPEQKAEIAAFVKSAGGIDESRGDSITVSSLPFTEPNIIRDMQDGWASLPPGPRPAAGGMTPGSWSWMIMIFPTMILMGLLAVFLLKQRKVQTEKSRLITASAPGAMTSDISDLLSDKVGRSTTPPATRVNTTEQLERLAKEKPTKVAEMLKSTWLAEKER